MKFFFIFLMLVGLIGAQPKASAMGFGDAALGVGISSGVGAVLGLSTLPFYPTPSDHFKNVFYGAAIGAVLGVVLTAASAVEQSSDMNAIRFPEEDKTRFARSSAEIDSTKSILDKNTLAIWSPVAEFHF